jgi:hypothetical protein
VSEFLPNASIPRRYAEEGASISINPVELTRKQRHIAQRGPLDGLEKKGATLP